MRNVNKAKIGLKMACVTAVGLAYLAIHTNNVNQERQVREEMKGFPEVKVLSQRGDGADSLGARYIGDRVRYYLDLRREFFENDNPHYNPARGIEKHSNYTIRSNDLQNARTSQ